MKVRTKKSDGIVIGALKIIAVVMFILVALMWSYVGFELYNRYHTTNVVVEEPQISVPGEKLLR